MNVKEIKELVDLVAKKGLAGLEVERAGFRLKIEGARAPEARTQLPMTYVVEPRADTPATPLPVVSREPAPLPAPPAVAAAASSPEPGGYVITSPIVGTFYRSPSPDSDPFVKVGDAVEKGKTICIVEAMKLMNEIECDVDGVVLAIHPQNGQPVEYGEKLFTIQLR